MPQVYTGEIRDGMVVFDGTPSPLPSGTRVRIELIIAEDTSAPVRTATEDPLRAVGNELIIPEDISAPVSENTAIAGTRGLLLDWARQAEAIAPPMPVDLATEHDHYAHGKPRAE